MKPVPVKKATVAVPLTAIATDLRCRNMQTLTGTVTEKSVPVFLCLLLWFTACQQKTGTVSAQGKQVKTVTVGILPMGRCRSGAAATAAAAIRRQYGWNTRILPPAAIPRSFFTAVKTPRYRADSIIRYLSRMRTDSLDYLIAVTSEDISTTITGSNGKIKEPASRYSDWGVFGLGYIGKSGCVISTRRLMRGGGDRWKSRLAKVAVHELGHNLGLPHCPSPECVMRDAVEKLASVDEESESLCLSCKNRIRLNP